MIYSKRGQELSITTLVLIVLGIIILVLLVLGFTKGWDFTFGKFDLLPGQDLEAIAQSCNIAVQGGLRLDFCSFKKIRIEGRNEYLNCKDSRIRESIQENNINCDGDIGDAGKYCERNKLKSSDLVNGQKCSDLVSFEFSCVNYYKGQIKTSCGAGEKEREIENKMPTQPNNKCCVRD